MMVPASGLDTLQVRRAYLRKRRTRHADAWRRTALWIIVGGIACWACIAGVSFLIAGS